jgi:inhibitor of cysteine peptidase
MHYLVIVTLLVCFPITFAVGQSRIEVAANKLFTLTLESTPSTGYQWELSQSLDETRVKVIDSFYREANANHIGAKGVQFWLFRAVEPGETTIFMKHVRPWEKDAVPAETASFSIIIK